MVRAPYPFFPMQKERTTRVYVAATTAPYPRQTMFFPPGAERRGLEWQEGLFPGHQSPIISRLAGLGPPRAMPRCAVAATVPQPGTGTTSGVPDDDRYAHDATRTIPQNLKKSAFCTMNNSTSQKQIEPPSGSSKRHTQHASGTFQNDYASGTIGRVFRPEGFIHR